MRLLTTFAALVPLCTVVFANPPLQMKYDCHAYDINNIGNDNVVWKPFGRTGELYHGPMDKHVVDKHVADQVIQSKGRNSNDVTAYWYTLHGGFGKFDENNKDAIVLYAQADRTSGEGMGQQFRVNFWGENDKHLASYWVYPQQRCIIDPTKVPGGAITAEMIKKVDANYAVY